MSILGTTININVNSGNSESTTNTPNDIKDLHIATLNVVPRAYSGIDYLEGWTIIDGTLRWVLFENDRYLGDFEADPTIIDEMHDDSHFYYRTSDNQWRGIIDLNNVLAWENTTLALELSDNTLRDLGEFDSQSEASENVADETLDNYAYFEGAWYTLQGRELFDGKIYVDDYTGFGGTPTPNGKINIPKTRLSDDHIGYFFELREGSTVVHEVWLPLGIGSTAQPGLIGEDSTFSGAVTMLIGFAGGDFITVYASRSFTIAATDNVSIRAYLAKN